MYVLYRKIATIFIKKEVFFSLAKGEGPLSFPDVLHCDNEHNNYIIMENLKTKGYRLIHDVDPSLRWALTTEQVKRTLLSKKQSRNKVKKKIRRPR